MSNLLVYFIVVYLFIHFTQVFAILMLLHIYTRYLAKKQMALNSILILTTLVSQLL